MILLLRRSQLSTHTHTHTHSHTSCIHTQSVPMNELSSMEDWLANVFPLCPVLVEESLSIEDCDTLTLQVCCYIQYSNATLYV